MKPVLLIGRILFSPMFIVAPAMNLFKSSTAAYAASAGVPAASILVPLAGIIAILGGLSILLGFKAEIGGWLIVIFLVPVTLFMHGFWTIDDAMQRQDQMIHFMLNVSLTGAALIIAYFGSGPLSLSKD